MNNTTGQISYLFLQILTLGLMVSAEDLQFDVVDQNFNSSNRVVITEDQIKKSHAANLPQLISSQANISVASTSFQPNSIYIRGGDSSHVLILVDGLPTYDPSTVQKTVNLSNINLKSIRRIEIIKGSQSVLYGGQALSGIIKIETFPQQVENKTQATVQGNQNLLDVSATHLQKVSDSAALSAALRGADMKNPSPVQDSAKRYPQRQGSAETAVLYKDGLGHDHIFKLNYADDKNQIATSNFATYQSVDTDNFKANTESYGASIITQKKDKYLLGLSYQHTRRLFLQTPEDAGATGIPADQDYRSELVAGRFEYSPVNNATTKATLGYSHTQERAHFIDPLNAPPPTYTTVPLDFAKTNQYEGLFFKADQKLNENFLAELGFRRESSKLFTIANVYQIGFTWKEKIRFEHSTGFKTPSLYQLYGAYGDANLQEERGQNTSITFEVKKNKEYLTSLTLFDSQFENLIVIAGTPQKYTNISKVRALGGEIYTSYVNEDLGLHATLSVGYQEPKDLSSGLWLNRRPLRTANVKLTKSIGDEFSSTAEIQHVGSRVDKGPSKTYPTLDAYTLVNVVANFKHSENFSTFLRVDNLTNVTYQTALGYYTSGVNPKLGLEMTY